MTRPSPGRSRWPWRGVVLIAWLMVAGGGPARAQPPPRKQGKMQGNETTLWQALTAVGAQMPFTREKLEKALGVPFTLKERTEYTSLWVAGPVLLKDQVQVTSITLLLDPKDRFDDESSGATLQLAGRCVPLSEVRTHHADLKITQFPRGRSPQETTVHTARAPWGRISFGFKESRRECLSEVTFGPEHV
jgi:hypothetical protein